MKTSARLADLGRLPAERLAFAVVETRRRLQLAERSLEHALGESQRADAIAQRVRVRVKDLAGELRLLESLLGDEQRER